MPSLAHQFNTALAMNSVHLSADDISRYSRQLLLDDIDEEGQARLKQAYAVVIGLGGLGTLVARYLVGAGIGKVLLVDTTLLIRVTSIGKCCLTKNILANTKQKPAMPNCA